MTATQAPTPGPLSALAFHCESARLVPLLRKEAERLGKGVPTDLPGLHKDIWTAAEIIEQAEEAFAFRQKMDALAPTAPVEDVSETNTSSERVKKAAKNEHVAAPVEASGSEREISPAYRSKLIAECEERIRNGNVLGAVPMMTVGAQTLLAALRPQPSGETREAVARIIDPSAFLFSQDELPKGSRAQFDAFDRADRILALLSTHPRALGGQQGECRTCNGKRSVWESEETEYVECPDCTTPARAEAQDEGAAGERDTSDAIDLLIKSRAALKGHIAAIQAGKKAADKGETGIGEDANPIVDCINALPEIVRWLDAGKFEIEAAFEAYEDNAHLSPTPAAADADRVRIAVEALKDIQDTTAELGTNQKATEALAALKSEGKA